MTSGINFSVIVEPYENGFVGSVPSLGLNNLYGSTQERLLSFVAHMVKQAVVFYNEQGISVENTPPRMLSDGQTLEQIFIETVTAG